MFLIIYIDVELRLFIGQAVALDQRIFLEQRGQAMSRPLPLD